MTAETTARLKALYRECRLPNWDGYGAEPITPDTLELARQFCDALPEDVLEPEVCAEPDGGISLEWGGRDNNLSVSLCDGCNAVWCKTTDGTVTSGVFENAEVRLLLPMIREANG